MISEVTSPKKKLSQKEAGQRHLERMRKRNAAQSKATADVGPIPDVVNLERREACRHDLHLFLTTYFPHSTGLKPFSDDHLDLIQSMENVILKGGRRVNAFFRGGAKTTIAENSILWAAVYGHRKYMVVYGADQGAADQIIGSIKTELESNDLLFEDFPEVCHPIVELAGIATRCNSQTVGGERTRIKWGTDKLVLPTVVDKKGNYLPSSAICVQAKGFSGGTRGLAHKNAEGKKQRPDLVLLDDIQTDELAGNPASVAKALKIIKRAILKLGGHGTQLAAINNGTVIEENDVIDQLLDHNKHPEWQGLRYSMVKKWANKDAHDELWLGEYARIRRTYDIEDPNGRPGAEVKANDYYLANREDMDAGCVVAWEHCFATGDDGSIPEYSAIQHAYNALIDDGEETFASEFQNQPMKAEHDGETILPAKQFAIKVNMFKKRIVPGKVEKIVLSIDVQQRALFWSLIGYSPGFDMFGLDYGTFPEMGRTYYSYKEVKPTIQQKFPGLDLEIQIEKALTELISLKCGRTYTREDGVEMGIDIVIPDAGYQTKSVKRVAAHHPQFANIIFPTFGQGIKASACPMMDYRMEQFERRSKDYSIPWRLLPEKRGGGRHVMFDTNSVKTFLHRRIAIPAGNSGSFTMYQGRRHDMYADHFCASEVSDRIEGRGRVVNEWRHLPHRPDNHFLDTGTMSVVGASMLGVVLAGTEQPKRRKAKRKTKKVSYL